MKHGISVESLCNKARRDRWVKPEKFVSRTAKEALEKAAIAIALSHAASEPPTRLAALLRPPTDIEIGERMTSLVRLTSEVLLDHRGDIRELAHLTTKQLGEFKAMSSNVDRLVNTVQLASDIGAVSDDEAKEIRRELRAVCELKGRLVALGMFTAQFERLQNMERQAFGIEAGERPEGDEADVVGIVVEFVDAQGNQSGEFPTQATSRTARRIV